MNNLQGYIWDSNSKGYMTPNLSLNWFDNHSVPELREHCRANNLDFRVVFFMDNAPGRAHFLISHYGAVEVVFLPPNTTSKIKLMDQDIIANTELIFYQHVHDELKVKTDTLQELQAIQELGAGLVSTVPH